MTQWLDVVAREPEQSSDALGLAAALVALPRTEVLSQVAGGSIATSQSAVALAAYDQYVACLAAGEMIDPEEYCDRFPHVRSSLANFIRHHHQGVALILENAHLLAAPPAPSWPSVGSRFQGFLLQERLGEGSFAHVYRASDLGRGDKAVVVKISFQGGTEGKILGRLKHPNIVPVDAAREEEETGLTVVCMPYLGRATLHRVLDVAFAQKQTPPDGLAILEAARDESLSAPPPAEPFRRGYVAGIRHIGAQIADALAYVHKQEIYHRDLKPSNVLLAPDGTALLLDFNLSADPRQSEVRLGGTLAYMSPEQLQATDWQGNEPPPQLDGRSDLYSLGVILYELLAGRHPFGPVPYKAAPRELRQYLLEQQRQGFRPLRQVCPQVDARLSRLVDHLLANDPAQRPQTAAEVARELRYEPPAVRSYRWLKRHPLRVGLAALSLAVCSLVAGALGANVAQPSDRDKALAKKAFDEGIQAYQDKNFQQAIQHLDRAIEAQPGYFEAHVARGRAFLQQGDAALVEEQRLTLLNQPVAAAKAKEQGEKLLESALKDLTKATDVQGDGRTVACLGYAYHRLGNIHMGGKYYEEALSRGFQSAEVHNNWAAILTDQCQVDKAIQQLKLADAKRPELQATLYNSAWACFGKYLTLKMKSELPKETDTQKAKFRAEALLYRNKARQKIQQAIDVGPRTGELFRKAAIMNGYFSRTDQGLTPTVLGQLKQAVALGIHPQVLLRDRAFAHLCQDPVFQQIMRTPSGPAGQEAARWVFDPLGDEPY